MKRVSILASVVFCLAGLLLTGCNAPEDWTLRIAVLPILDTLPLYVADVEGYFTEQGVDVEFITAASAAERDQLLQAGQVDGVVTDLVALALYNRDATQVAAVRYAMVPTPEFAQFRILAAGQSGLTSVDALRGVPIGISEGTVIEYVTYKLLQAEGLASADVVTLAVPKIPDRMALLGAGELEAAMLPEPLASLAMQGGAVAVVDDTRYPDVSCSVFAFRKDVLDAQPKTVRGFLAAVDKASTAINVDKGRWRDLLAENGLVPPPLMGAYELPDYPPADVPTAAQFDDVSAWLQDTGRLTTMPSYQDVVDASFLPGK